MTTGERMEMRAVQRVWVCLLISASLLTTACSEDESAITSLPAWDEALQVAPIQPFSDQAIWHDVALTRGVRFVSPLPTGGVLVFGADGSWRVAGGTQEVLDEGGRLNTETIIEALTLPTGEVMVATETSVFAVSSGLAQRAPFAFELASTPTDMAMVVHSESDVSLWVATQESLYVWRNDALNEVRVNDTAMPAAQLEVAGDGVTVWAAAGGQLVALSEAEGGLSANVEGFSSTVQALDVDGRDALWVLTDQGEVFRRNSEGTWQALQMDRPVTSIHTHVQAPYLWLVDDANALWLYTGTTRELVADASPGVHRAVGPRGLLNIAQESEVQRWYPGADVQLSGLSDRGMLDGAIDIMIEPVFPERVQAVEARINTALVEVKEDPWRVAVDPITLEQGRYTLDVTVNYGRNEPQARRQLRFEVSAVSVTWNEFIEPIYAARCATCHDGSSGARVLRSSADWQSNIEPIIQAVISENMPPTNPKLTAAEIEQIQQWQAGGFPE